MSLVGVNTVIVDVLASCVTRPSVAKVLTMQDKWDLVVHKKRCQLPAPSQCFSVTKWFTYVFIFREIKMAKPIILHNYHRYILDTSQNMVPCRPPMSRRRRNKTVIIWWILCLVSGDISKEMSMQIGEFINFIYFSWQSNDVLYEFNLTKCFATFFIGKKIHINKIVRNQIKFDPQLKTQHQLTQLLIFTGFISGCPCRV